MEVPIKHKSLVDSPYSDSQSDGIFLFPNSEVEELVQDLMHGSPTCYLVSGYRGAGKSSYIRKLQSELDSKEKTQKNQKGANHLFVELNFAKYEEQSIVLRKLIRAYYLTFSKHNSFKDILENEPTRVEQFKELYERTFFDVSKNTNVKNFKSKSTTASFEVNLQHIALILGLVLGIIGVAELITESYNWFLASVFFIIAGLVRFKHTATKGEDSSNETTHSELYDNEIAEYHLLRMIDCFSEFFRLVFVLDELDKIHDHTQAEKLITELKPIMLSGKANFIVVAGQSMFYRYHASMSQDDGFLSSLFSKVHHVSLFSAAQLRTVFDGLIDVNYDLDYQEKEKGGEERHEKESIVMQQLLGGYKECLVFKSMRVPRKFMLLIRQELRWKDNKAFVKIERQVEEYDLYVKLNKRLSEVEDEIDAQGFDAAISDYLKMQLMLQAHAMINSKGDSFTVEKIVNAKRNG